MGTSRAGDGGRESGSQGEPWSLYDQVMLALAAAVPGCAALLHAENITDVAHDGGVVRTVGLGWDGPWHALDAWVAAPFLVLPIGTQTFRAGMASAVTCAVAGAVLYALIRALLAACARGSGSKPGAVAGAPSRLGPAVAAIGSLMASLSMAWQTEALAPGGAMLGALLVVLSVAMVAHAPGSLAAAAFPCALALTYEPWVGVASLAACVVGHGVAWFCSSLCWHHWSGRG